MGKSAKKRAAKQAKRYADMAQREYKTAEAMSKAEKRSVERRRPVEVKDAPTMDKLNTSSRLTAPATSSDGTRGRKLTARAPRVNPRAGLR